MFRFLPTTPNCLILASIIVFSSPAKSQNLESFMDELQGEIGLCEARYNNDGFNSVLSFIVGCINPAMESFYKKAGAPSYMYEGVKSQGLTMGAKVDAGEIDLLTAMTKIAEVANVTFSQLASSRGTTTSPGSSKSNEATASACRQKAEIAKSNVEAQYDNEWLAFMRNNPQPRSTSGTDQALQVLNGANQAQILQIQLQEQEQMRLWVQKINQNKAIHNRQKENATTSAYESTLQLCMIDGNK